MRATTRIRWGMLGSAFLAAVACHDHTVTSPVPGAAGPVLASSGGTDTNTTSFTIVPGRSRTVRLGEHKLYIGDNVTCDPRTTPYGPEHWDKPCELATSAIKVVAKYWVDQASGRPYVSFSPDLRFAPTNKPDKWVTLTLKDPKAARHPHSSILYCPTVGGACYDEAASDPEVATVRDPKNGFLTRRLKHFSGYNVAIGRVLE